jgi:hypothetical protein
MHPVFQGIDFPQKHLYTVREHETGVYQRVWIPLEMNITAFR